jgi:alkanesulfonate monooxygenase SsuD/methylene tetrahydromethanopterin reductase-like flavin-dependent oxidoreductase (luciferase family)
VQILSENRPRRGLDAGENLNEHVVGKRWPAVGERDEMLSEALEVISELFDGDPSFSFRGTHLDVSRPSCGICRPGPAISLSRGPPAPRPLGPRRRPV